MQFHLFSLGGDIGLNWADLYEVPEALTQRLSHFEQPAGRRRVEDMPIVTPSDPLPEWSQMPDEGPLIFHMKMRANDVQTGFSMGFDYVGYLLQGSLALDDDVSASAGEFLCVSADQTHSLTAGEQGAEWLVFASQSRHPT